MQELTSRHQIVGKILNNHFNKYKIYIDIQQLKHIKYNVHIFCILVFTWLTTYC